MNMPKTGLPRSPPCRHANDPEPNRHGSLSQVVHTTELRFESRVEATKNLNPTMTQTVRPMTHELRSTRVERRPDPTDLLSLTASGKHDPCFQ
jgi:hypothetical protein